MKAGTCKDVSFGLLPSCRIRQNGADDVRGFGAAFCYKLAVSKKPDIR